MLLESMKVIFSFCILTFYKNLALGHTGITIFNLLFEFKYKYMNVFSLKYS